MGSPAGVSLLGQLRRGPFSRALFSNRASSSLFHQTDHLSPPMCVTTPFPRSALQWCWTVVHRTILCKGRQAQRLSVWEPSVSQAGRQSGRILKFGRCTCSQRRGQNRPLHDPVPINGVFRGIAPKRVFGNFLHEQKVTPRRVGTLVGPGCASVAPPQAAELPCAGAQNPPQYAYQPALWRSVPFWAMETKSPSATMM